MNFGRMFKVAALDIRSNLTRPLFWILVFILALTAWGLSTGSMRIASGDSMVGGTKAWLTSEFSIAQMLAFVVFLFYAFFIAVAAGMTVIHDDELKVGKLLHATSLKPTEYIYGKLLAVFVSFMGILAVHLALTILFYQFVPSPNATEVRGPFDLMNYLRPALFFAIPTIIFLIGTAFAVGVWTRNTILVFVLPVAMMLVCAFFLWDWSPSWLSPGVNRALMVIEPAGFRWLSETWLRVDQGVEYYNTARMSFDMTFWLNRFVVLAVAFGSIGLAHMRFLKQVRGAVGAKRSKAMRQTAEPVPSLAPAAQPAGSLAEIAMRGRAPGFLKGSWLVAKAEIKELRSHAGLYLFVPLILIQVVGSTFFNLGPFDTPLLATPGIMAISSMGMITTLVCLLLLFYTVESLERERSSGLGRIYLSTPVRTGSILFGKSLANTMVAAIILVTALLGCMLVLAIQGQVAMDLTPFFLAWGLLLIPTFLVWTTFVMALQSLVRNKYTTYALALGVLILTGYKSATGQLNWVGNWPIWGAATWSDFGAFELNRVALIMNRFFVLGLSALFVAMTIRFYGRADRDASQTGARLRPGSLLRGAVGLSPYMLVPAVLAVIMWTQLHQGSQGDVADKAQKDYWRRNLATWRDASYPAVTNVDLALEIDPARRWMKSDGEFTLVNRSEEIFDKVPLTRGFHWENVSWTMNGDSAKTDDRVGLVVFEPDPPLAPGDTMVIGFSFDGQYPKGMSKNGGGSPEFILPSGTVLTSFTPAMAPLVGYIESIGIDEENQYDAKEYPVDFHQGYTKPAFGTGHHMTTRVSITGPADYRFNSVGTQVSNEVDGDLRTTVWKSDHPVNFFNVVGGKWEERRGDGTVVYYHPDHAYNIDEISGALDASRKYFSEWFMEFPWNELRLSEFPALAGYAQGFPTNITFSEAMGFLTKDDPRANLAFMVTAHEAAHQWWGNILLPGQGPGGNVMSEGMAHFSTILLFEEVKGERQRIEFCKRIEERYSERRRVDSERPLVKLDGSKQGDGTVTYDKGGWTFWMLLNHMGRERGLAGVQDFIQRYSTGEDHAVLYDFIDVMREHAADVDAYDAFVQQWFLEVNMPRYKLSNEERALIPDASVASASSAGGVTGETWEAKVEIENAGTGKMPLDIAASVGERFPDEEEPAGEASDVTKKDPPVAYQEVREAIVLGAGERRTVTIRCPFKPERIVVDPDALVLQLQREQAIVTF